MLPLLMEHSRVVAVRQKRFLIKSTLTVPLALTSESCQREILECQGAHRGDGL